MFSVKISIDLTSQDQWEKKVQYRMQSADQASPYWTPCSCNCCCCQALWVQFLRHCRAGGVGAPRKCSPEPREDHNLDAPRCSEGLDWKRLVQHGGVSSAAQRAGSPKEVSQETVLIPGEGSQAVVSPSLMALTLRQTPQRCPRIPDRPGDALHPHP